MSDERADLEDCLERMIVLYRQARLDIRERDGLVADQEAQIDALRRTLVRYEYQLGLRVKRNGTPYRKDKAA